MNSKRDVVAAALSVLEADGLEGLTMRKVAAELGVQPGALYRHFPHKRALLEAMAEKLVEGMGDPLPPGHWQDQLSTIAARMRASLLSHRDAALVVAGTYVLEPNTVRAGQTAVDILVNAGIAPQRAAWAMFALGHYVLGHVIEEQAENDLIADGTWADKRAAGQLQVGERYAQTLGELFEANAEQRFAYGVETFLDGLERQIETPAGA